MDAYNFNFVPKFSLKLEISGRKFSDKKIFRQFIDSQKFRLSRATTPLRVINETTQLELSVNSFVCLVFFVLK